MKHICIKYTAQAGAQSCALETITLSAMITIYRPTAKILKKK
jgi:hypothetical protein